MSTIGTSLQHLSRTSVLAMQGPYYRLPKGQTAKYLPLSSVNGKQPGASSSGISFDYLYDGLKNLSDILNKRSKSYQVERQTTRTEFNRAMSEAGKSGASLKNIDYKAASQKTETVLGRAQKAADSLGETVKEAGLDKNARQSINGGLSAFMKYLKESRETDDDYYDKNDKIDKNSDDDEKEKAEAAAKEVKDTWEKATGVTGEETEEAVAAADKATAEVSHYAEVGAGTAAFMQQGAENILSYVERFEQIGRFDADAKRMDAVLTAFEDEAARSGNLSEAAGKLDDFAAKYQMDSEPDSTAVSTGVLTEYGVGIAKWGQEAKPHLTDSIRAVRDFLREGREASSETTAKARTAAETLAELAEGYTEATKLNQDDRQWLEDSARDMKALTKQAAKPFEYVGAIANFSRDYAAAETEADKTALATANDIQAALAGYNDNLAHLQDRRGMSTRFDSASRADGDGFLHDLEKIGLNVGFTGVISADTDKLATALKNDPEGTEKILGVNGLGGKMSESVARSSFRTGHTAATINYLGDRASSLLSPRVTAMAMLYGNGSNFMDMYL